MLRDDNDDVPEIEAVSERHTHTHTPVYTCSHLFICRIVRLPVLMLLMTTEAGRTH